MFKRFVVPVTVSALLLLAISGSAGAAAKTTTFGPSTSISIGPMKVKGYRLTLSATHGKSSSLSVSLVRGGQTHSYLFPKKNFSVHLSKSLSSGAISARLGKYGHFHVRFTATRKTHVVKPGKGCTGAGAQTRTGKITASSGSLVLDHSFFGTVHIGRVAASADRSAKEKCKVKKISTSSSKTPLLTVSQKHLDAFFERAKHRATAEITVTTSQHPLVIHTLSLTSPASSFTAADNAATATVKGFGSLLTGSGSYAAGTTSYFQGGSSGTFGGNLVAHFDSIGEQKLAGGQATLEIPGFNPPPVADFSYSVANPGQLQFTDESSDSGGKIVSYAWSFGDGSTSTAQDPNHTYATSGTYTVTETVTDSHGAHTTVTKSVPVTANLPPQASFTADTSGGGFGVSFTDTSTDSDGSVVAWAWSFGDGTTSADENPTHTYTSGGPYTVTLTVTDSSGAQSTSSQSVTPTP
jgi:PKD repeat protein